MKILDTIYALATPPFKSALAIIRVSGTASYQTLKNLIPVGKNIKEREILYTPILYNGKLIDKAMVAYFAAPRSFTGEEMVEFYLHGSLLVIEELMVALSNLGLRSAQPGEFSQRAYFNQKIDLIKAEAINDLINARNYLAKEVALKNLGGRVSQIIDEAETELQEIACQLNVNIDYPEYYDIRQLEKEEILPKLINLHQILQNIAKNSQFGKIISNGVKVAIVGKPNVGKSTILNALLKRDKAITSNVPGTTRDIVEGEKIIGGINFVFFDTAGIRQTKEKIERKGIAKSLNALKESDIALVILDSDNLQIEDKKILAKTKNKKRIVIRNKKDLNPNLVTKHLAISAISNNVEQLEETLINLVKVNEIDIDSNEFLTNSRQIGELQAAISHLESAINTTSNSLGLDLVQQDINFARQSLSRLLGKEVMSGDQEIFSRFCIGK